MTNFERIANDRDLIFKLVIENDGVFSMVQEWYCNNKCPYRYECGAYPDFECKPKMYVDKENVANLWLDAECQEEKEEEP